jgi:hypothetical protein
MKILSFESYDEYKSVQVRANKLKFSQVYAEDPELRRIAAHFLKHSRGAGLGLCHGVRNGYEVRKLRSLLPNVSIIGTDISPTAEEVENCIVWDMHEIKPEWVGAVDFMYSNSWDHAYDPNLLFARWSECLAPGGRLYLSYTDLHSERGVNENTKIDVFGCSLDELARIVQPAFVLDEILDVAPVLTLQTWRRRLAYLREGQLEKALMARLTSRRVQVLVLRPSR